MVSVYTKIPITDILVTDDYSGEERLHILTDLQIGISKSSELGFLACAGVKDGKIQSITNKQLFYIPTILQGMIGTEHGNDLKNVVQTLVNTNKDSHIYIETPVFYFMDYESLQGTGHSYDLCFYLLYMYKKLNLSCPLLIPDTDHPFMNTLYGLLEKYCGVSFLRIKFNCPYLFSKVFCVRTYLNILFPEVKEFVSSFLIQPILEAHSHLPTFHTVARMKILPKEKVLTQTTIFQESATYTQYCEENKILLLDDKVTEEEKIYYLNNAKRIMVCWGSIYYIYIHYYLVSAHNRFLSVIFHNGIMPERRFLTITPSGIHQNCIVPIPNNLYHTFSFYGEVLDNISTLEEVVEKSILKNIRVE
jgi:hypothetical protein